MKQQINLNKQILYFFFVTIFTLLFSGSVFAAENVSGVISIIGAKTYIKISDKSYLLQSDNKETLDQIKNFGNADFISGVGEILSDGKRLNLISIDFVGLKKLLGWWRIGANYYMNFRDFANFSYISTSAQPTSNNFKYAVAPDEETSKTWRLFITDSSSVHIGTLLLKDNQAKIQFYNSDTGLPTQALELFKVRK